MFLPGMLVGSSYAHSLRGGAWAVNAAKRGYLTLAGRQVCKYSASEIGMTWGKGIQQQGIPWEDFLAIKFYPNSRLPKNFKTFDFFDRSSGIATSAKTLNTGTASKLADPEKVYYSLKKNVDAAADFVEHSLFRVEINSEMITLRRLELAIPKATTSQQWHHIERAIEYSKSRGVELNISLIN